MAFLLHALIGAGHFRCDFNRFQHIETVGRHIDDPVHPFYGAPSQSTSGTDNDLFQRSGLRIDINRRSIGMFADGTDL